MACATSAMARFNLLFAAIRKTFSDLPRYNPILPGKYWLPLDCRQISSTVLSSSEINVYIGKAMQQLKLRKNFQEAGSCCRGWEFCQKFLEIQCTDLSREVAIVCLEKGMYA